MKWILWAAFFSYFNLFSQKNWDIIKVPDPVHPSQSMNCPMEGSAKNVSTKEGHLAWITNLEKNRWDVPISSQVRDVRIASLITRDAIKSKFKPGRPIQITAYVYEVKTGGVESCNCQTKAINFRDTHIVLTPDAQKTNEEFRMIAEVTPRLRMIMANEGVDWSTNNLKRELQGHTVTIQGWLFYDEIHEPQAFSTNPKNQKGDNWRASCWEIHPITKIILADSVVRISNHDESGIEPSISTEMESPQNTSMKKSPRDIFFIVMLGSVLGMLGQGIRTIVGLKKLYDSSRDSKHFNEMFSSKKLFLSFAMAAIIGFVAGALMAIYNIDANWDNSTILATIGAGYAGVDFIEGLLGKNFLEGKS